MELEVEHTEFIVCTTKVFYDYLCNEIEFWTSEDENGKLMQMIL